MIEKQQGLCYLSLLCKVVFSNILHHATPPFQKEKKVNMGRFKDVKIKKDVMFLRRVGTRLDY